MPSGEHIVASNRRRVRSAFWGKSNIPLAAWKKEKSAESRSLRSTIQMSTLAQILSDDSGQDIAEYAVMLAVILVLVVGTIRLIGSNANNAFSNAASALQ
jgi:Flp pilus assembly pilin Flp